MEETEALDKVLPHRLAKWRRVLWGLALHPLLREGLPRGDAGLAVEAQQVRDHPLRAGGHPIPLGRAERELPASHPAEYIAVGAAGERRVAAEQDEGDYPGGPHIAHLGVLAFKHLRRHVEGSANLGVHRRPALESCRQPKVDELELGVRRVALQEEIFGLDVPVRNAVGMQVAQCRQHLPSVGRTSGLRELAVLVHDPVEQLAAAAELHDHVEALGLAEGLEQPRDVRVVQQPGDGDLHVGLLGLPLPGHADALRGPRKPRAAAQNAAGATGGAHAELGLDVIALSEATAIVPDEVMLEVERPGRSCAPYAGLLLLLRRRSLLLVLLLPLLLPPLLLVRPLGRRLLQPPGPLKLRRVRLQLLLRRLPRPKGDIVGLGVNRAAG
mmetsp:Transcript_7766/g.22219  ORF Transcript_7766/g.22219 Transcript_7766/m.22219 type:complete len:384 (+) Transcript_7766:657-1808(+)